MDALHLPPRDFQWLQALRITTMKKITGNRAEFNSTPNWLSYRKTSDKKESHLPGKGGLPLGFLTQSFAS